MRNLYQYAFYIGLFALYGCHQSHNNAIRNTFWIEQNVKGNYYDAAGYYFADTLCYPFVIVNDSLFSQDYSLLDGDGCSSIACNNSTYKIISDTLTMSDFKYMIMRENDTMKLKDINGNSGDKVFIQSKSYSPEIARFQIP